MPRVAKSKPADSTANLGFEAKLWLAADTAMRDSAMPPCEAILRSLSEAKDNLRINTDHIHKCVFIDARKLGALIDRVPYNFSNN